MTRRAFTKLAGAALLIPHFNVSRAAVVHQQTIPLNSAASYHLQDNLFGNDGDFESVSRASASQRAAGSFTAGSTYGLRRVILHLEKVGTPTFTVVAQIFTSTGLGAGTAIPLVQTGADSTTVLDSSTVGTGVTAVTFDWASDINLTSGTQYWVVLKASAVGDDTHKLLFLVDTVGVAENVAIATLAGAWTNDGATKPAIQTYSFS